MQKKQDLKTLAAYRDLVGVLADMEPNNGWHGADDLLHYVPPLSPEDLAVVCESRTQDVADELSIDPLVIASWLRGEVNDHEFLARIREATTRAVAEAVWPDVADRCDENNERRHERQLENYYGSSTPVSQREYLASLYSVTRTLR